VTLPSVNRNLFEQLSIDQPDAVTIPKFTVSDDLKELRSTTAAPPTDTTTAAPPTDTTAPSVDRSAFAPLSDLNLRSGWNALFKLPFTNTGFIPVELVHMYIAPTVDINVFLAHQQRCCGIDFVPHLCAGRALAVAQGVWTLYSRLNMELPLLSTELVCLDGFSLSRARAASSANAPGPVSTLPTVLSYTQRTALELRRKHCVYDLLSSEPTTEPSSDSRLPWYEALTDPVLMAHWSSGANGLQDRAGPVVNSENSALSRLILGYVREQQVKAIRVERARIEQELKGAVSEERAQLDRLKAELETEKRSLDVKLAAERDKSFKEGHAAAMASIMLVASGRKPE
jgi:hypothetical protein